MVVNNMGNMGNDMQITEGGNHSPSNTLLQKVAQGDEGSKIIRSLAFPIVHLFSFNDQVSLTPNIRCLAFKQPHALDTKYEVSGMFN